MNLLNHSGQGGEVFRFLIGAILALAILVIIIGIIAYLERWRIDVSNKYLYEGLNNAVQTPNGETVIRKKLTFAKGTMFTSGGFAHVAGLSPKCVTLLARKSANMTLEDNAALHTQTLKLHTNAVMDVYFRCVKSDDDACQPSGTSCEISFGQPFT